MFARDSRGEGEETIENEKHTHDLIRLRILLNVLDELFLLLLQAPPLLLEVALRPANHPLVLAEDLLRRLLARTGTHGFYCLSLVFSLVPRGRVGGGDGKCEVWMGWGGETKMNILRNNIITHHSHPGDDGTIPMS